MPADVLACKGSKRTGGRSSNTRGEDNVISNGSVIAVNDGQGMLVVQNGKIIEVALEPGEFVFDTGSEPSVFSGNLGDSIKETFANIGSRFTFGGDAGKDQRVYFINTKEIIGNKYGTASITTLVWTSTSPCAATASIRTASPTRCCSTPTYAAT